jgi:hypothetical protein
MSGFNPTKTSSKKTETPITKDSVKGFTDFIGLTGSPTAGLDLITGKPMVDRSASLVPKKQVQADLLAGAPNLSSLANPPQNEGMGMFGMKIPSAPSAPNLPSLGALGDISLPSGKGFLDAITPSRETAIAIAGGLSDFGAALQGRQGTGAQQIQANLGRLKQDKLDAEMDDPNSEKSKTFRGFLKNYYKDIGKDLPINDNLSYRQLSEMTPFLDKKFNMLMAQRAANAKETKNPYEKNIVETKKYAQNLNDNLAELETIIEKSGTKELTGPETNRKNQLTQEIAINYNKMLDPNSVVREGEAKVIAENLGINDWFTRPSTATKSIRGFRDQINRTANNSLKFYGGQPEFSIPKEISSKAIAGTMKGKDGKMYYVDANKNPISEVK